MDELCSALENLTLSDTMKPNEPKKRRWKTERILNRKPKRTLRCWKCKKIGHKKKQCKYSKRGRRKLWLKKLNNEGENQPMRVSRKK